MARIYPETVTVALAPDLERLHALAALVEKHAAAFRADLEKLMRGEDNAGSEIRE